MKRLGLIVPSSNTVMEVDFYRNLPKHITLHVARMYLRDTTVSGEEQMLDLYFPRALEDLATARPHAVVFGCTSAGALRGNSYEAEICKRIESATGSPGISVASCVRESIRKRNIQKVVVITPYVDELNERIRRSLETDGLEVVLIAGLGISDNFEIANVTPEAILEFTLGKMRGQKAQGVFISCTNFRALEVRDRLEHLTKLPVVTSNQAALEKVVDLLNNAVGTEDQPIPGRFVQCPKGH